MPFLHVPWLLHVAMWVLAVASLVTLGQRLHTVRTSPGAMDPLDHGRPNPRVTPRRAERAVSTPDRDCRRDARHPLSRSAANSPTWATPRAGGWCARCRSSLARNAFDAGALYAARGGGPEQLRKNLARVLGVPPAEVPGSLIRASLASYARYWREAFRLPSMDHRT